MNAIDSCLLHGANCLVCWGQKGEEHERNDQSRGSKKSSQVEQHTEGLEEERAGLGRGAGADVGPFAGAGAGLASAGAGAGACVEGFGVRQKTQGRA